MARSSRELDSLTDGAAGTQLTVRPGDVTDPAGVRGVFEAVSALWGPPTTVITCAGSIDGLGSVAQVDPDRWWSAVTVDLRGTMLIAQAAVTAMVPQGRGRIITVYGNLGDRGAPNVSAFAAAKGGVARFTETLATEMRGAGVAVLGMHPGFVRTPMTEHLAWGDEGRRRVPEFGHRAETSWGDGGPAIRLLDQILAGAADNLAGRILHADDDLADLARRMVGNDALRRLRVQLGSESSGTPDRINP